MLSRRGLPSQAFEYILYNKGLMGEDSYPYRAKVFPAQPRPLRWSGPGTGSNSSSLSPQNGTCKFQPEKAIAFVKDVINITQVRPRGLRFQTSRAVPGRCWDAPRSAGLRSWSAPACVLLAESELLCTLLLSCTPFGRWHQGRAGAKMQALGSCLLPTVGAPPGWDEVPVLILQLST